MSFLEFLKQNWAELLTLVREHIFIVFVATAFAVLVGVPLGVLLTRRKSLQAPVLGVANVLQTVPSLALFGLLIPLPFVGGIGARSAIIALALYALLPVIRNTVTGIMGVDARVREAATAMGMTDWQKLRLVELPLALPVILTGVRVAVVISVGVATVAAAVGAGGLGTYIFRGLRQNDNNLLIAGALFSALLALFADFALGLIAGLYTTREHGANAGNAWSQKFQARRKTVLVAVTTACLLLVGLTFLPRLRNRATNPAGVTSGAPVIRVGSKDFTESAILAEILAQELERQGVRVERKLELGGNLAHDALVANQLDVYPEYTGTAYTAILKHAPVTDPQKVYAETRDEYAAKFGLTLSPSLGFSNDFAILVRGEMARTLNLKNISDAVSHARVLQAGFGQDFMSRADGYRGFVRAYGFNFVKIPREMDLSLTYRALQSGELDIIAGNSTDGLIAALDLFQLADDKHYFPPYQAVFIARQDKAEILRAAFEKLNNAISTDDMRRLNYEVDGKHRQPREVAAEWLQLKLR